jgi:hypothetical protein
MNSFSRRSVFFCAGSFCIKGSRRMNSTSALIEASEYGTTAQLFNELRDFLAKHPGLTQDSVLKLTYFCFAILFPDCAVAWPFVSVVAPDALGSSLLLRMLCCVCLSPVQIGEVTLSAMLTLPTQPRPSVLLIDQPAPTKELERVLRIVSRPGGRILRKGIYYDLSVPTLTCTAEPLSDPWISDQAIQIGLMPIRGTLPKIDARSLTESARKFRGQLLHYTDVNLTRVRDSPFDAPDFISPMREIAITLGNCIVDDVVLQRAVLSVLKPQDQDVRIKRASSIEAVVTEAALFLAHEVNRRQARVGEFATIVNGILRGRGETFELDPRAVGNQLRALGLFSQRLDRAGRGIRFTNEIRRNIHLLGLGYDISSIREQSSDCQFCAEARSCFGSTPDKAS